MLIEQYCQYIYIFFLDEDVLFITSRSSSDGTVWVSEKMSIRIRHPALNPSPLYWSATLTEVYRFERVFQLFLVFYSEKPTDGILANVKLIW